MEELYNIFIIGNKGCGKTSLHNAFLDYFQRNQNNNIQLDNSSKLFINKNICFFIV
jgi:chromosomal replication initiation ATPase DnaA